MKSSISALLSGAKAVSALVLLHLLPGCNTPDPPDPAQSPGTIGIQNTQQSSSEISQVIAQASTHMAQNKFDKARRSIEEASLALANLAPLRLSQVHLLSEPAKGYGQFTIRKDNVFNSEDPIRIYLEPENFDSRKTTFWQIHLVADVALANVQGAELKRLPDFLVAKIESQSPNRDIKLELVINIPGIPSGKYQIIIDVRDELAKEKARTRIKFEVK